MCEFIGVSQRIKPQDFHDQIFITSLHVSNNVQFTLKIGSIVCTNVNTLRSKHRAEAGIG